MLSKMINNFKTLNIRSKMQGKGKRMIFSCLTLCVSMFACNNTVKADDYNPLKPVLVTAIEVSPSISKKQAIQTESIKHVGVPYVYGGTTTRGFDCSGFTQYVFKNSDIYLPRIARDQANIDSSANFANKTVTIWDRNKVEPGDLVFFSNTPGRVSHVGIALADNKWIHASTSIRAITIANRSGWYNQKFTKAIRVI